MPSDPRPKFVALRDFALPGQLGSFQTGDPISGVALTMPSLIRDGFIGKNTTARKATNKEKP